MKYNVVNAVPMDVTKNSPGYSYTPSLRSQDRIWFWTPDLTLRTQGKPWQSQCLLGSTMHFFPLLWWLLQPIKVSYSPILQRLERTPSWADQKNILSNLNKHLIQYIYLATDWYHIYFGIMIFFLILHINALYHNLEGKGTSDGP